jgi:NAD(P)-dependent dehydrogenase (short-subunit alcohol dehydrogenase family)
MTKTALVTGAGGGLGAAIARRFAEEGYRIALLDNDRDGVAEQARRLPGALALQADVSDESQVEDALATFVEAFGGPPDALVNNAGIVRFGPLLEHSVADFRRVVDVNLVGTYITARATARLMVERGSGTIVNITSLNAVAPSPDAGAYPASKAAVALLTEHLALVLAPRGIRVNAVAPGFVDAGMSEPIYRDPRVRAARASAVPARELGTAEDVADVVLFLSSDQARYVHGQQIMVDGGVSFSLKLHLPREAPTVRF